MTNGTNRNDGMIHLAEMGGLDAGILYEAVIELANEGLLTAACIDAAARVLLTQLGLPDYFFRNISKEALKRVLHAVAMNVQIQDGKFVLSGNMAETQMDVDGGVQVRISTGRTRDRMEELLTEVIAGRRAEYYYGSEYDYTTYLVRSERCKPLAELRDGESTFAFAQQVRGDPVPEATRRRYEEFRKRALASVTPLVEASEATANNETRIMFMDDFRLSRLPVIRQMLKDLGIRLNRAYWETYQGPTDRVESICSLYLNGYPKKTLLNIAIERLQALMALRQKGLEDLYVQGNLTFDELCFAVSAAAFTHNFIYKQSQSDHAIVEGLARPELRAAMTKRIFDNNRAEYTRQVITDATRRYPELIRSLYRIFERKFNPHRKNRPTAGWIKREIMKLRHQLGIQFIDDTTTHDIFHFMSRFIDNTLKTNFYKKEKRSFAFRVSPEITDPLVFHSKMYGIFFVSGLYSIGTHMRADDIARGGLRLIRVTAANYETELDNMPLLNFALGPVAQRLKHKDIAESGAKGVIVPGVEYARDSLRAVFDITEGIMDLIQPSREVVDYLGKPEMIFFGPDEGTAGCMDAVAARARERGYKHWRTITTGKSIGVPHDEYGLTDKHEVLGLIPHDGKTELQIDGVSKLLTADTEQIFASIGDRIDTTGMTTMSVLTTFRTLLAHAGLKEEDVNLMMTGGPDGDLGANQIQSFKGRISLIIDGGSVLFDPKGLDRSALMKIAFARHTEPRLNSMAFPESVLSKDGFKAPRITGPLTLPNGDKIDDAAFFHRNFLTSPAMRRYVEKANIQAFIPCGGFKDTINASNVSGFLSLFPELRLIVEGANVFFDDTAREAIARKGILQIRDSSANKGGVTCSAIAEVLSAFLLGNQYEEMLVKDAVTKSKLIREVFDLIRENAAAETRMLLGLHEKTGKPLYRLSVETSEHLFAMQDRFMLVVDKIVRDKDVCQRILNSYIPDLILDKLGMPRVMRILGAPELIPYRNAILTKKLAALALYGHAVDWEEFLKRVEKDAMGVVRELAGSA